MRNGFILGSLAALVLSGPAWADDGFSYTYIDLGYGQTELDDLDVDGDGMGVRGSYEFTDRFHGLATYTDQDFDFGVRAKQFTVGGGFSSPLKPNLDIVGTVSYVNVDLSGPGGSVDDDGVELGALLRGRVTGQLELTGGLQYVNLNDGGDDTSLRLGARFFITPMFAIGADLGIGDDVTTWMLGGRVNFGR